MKTEIGFELIGKFRMPNDEPPGLEGGQTITVFFGDAPLSCVVTKVVTDGAERIVSFGTPLVSKIEPPPPQQ